MRRAILSLILPVLALSACGGSQTPAHHGGRTHSPSFLQSARNAHLALPSGIGISAPAVRGYDAVTVANLPLGAAAVLCYADGPYANCTAVRNREPRAHLIGVDVTAAGPVARILDTEPQDATPAQDPGWVRRMIAAHVYDPGVYSDASEMPAVKSDLAAAGLRRSQYVLMVADWDGNPLMPVGYDAIQYRSTATLDYDSFSAAFFSAPKPPPAKLVCWGPQAKLRNATCIRERALVSRWSHERSASARALARSRATLASHRCLVPYRRGVCVKAGSGQRVFAHRVAYFGAKVKAAERRY